MPLRLKLRGEGRMISVGSRRGAKERERGKDKPCCKTRYTTLDRGTNRQSQSRQAQQNMQGSAHRQITHVSPPVALLRSVLSIFLIPPAPPPPGTGSIVSRRRTPEPGRRTVCERSLSTVFVRPLAELEEIIAETGGPPLALLFSNMC